MLTDDRPELAPGPPIERAHVEDDDKRKKRQPCPECGKTVGNLPSHLAQIHGIRGGNAGRAKRDRSPRGAGETGTPDKPVATPAELGEAIAFLYSMAGQLIAQKDPVCGSAFIQTAPGIGQAWTNACEQSETIRRFAAAMMGGGAFVGLALAHMPIMLVVLDHHGPAARARAQEDYDRWVAEQQAEHGPGWVPPVDPSDAYGTYAPGSADSAR